MKVACTSCKGNIPGADIDLASRIAVCRACGELVPLPAAEDIPPPTPDKPASLAWDEQQSDDGYHAVVDIPGRAAGFAFLPLLLMMVAAAALMLAAHVWLAGVLAGVVAIAFGYLALMTLLQKLSISLDQTKLTWKVVPLRLTRERSEAIADVRRFETFQMQWGWVARVVMRDGRVFTLPMAFRDARHAAYVAGRLNDVLTTPRDEAGYRSNAHPGATLDVRARVAAAEQEPPDRIDEEPEASESLRRNQRGG